MHTYSISLKKFLSEFFSSEKQKDPENLQSIFHFYSVKNSDFSSFLGVFFGVFQIDTSEGNRYLDIWKKSEPVVFSN